jgi:hypothetical protein
MMPFGMSAGMALGRTLPTVLGVPFARECFAFGGDGDCHEKLNEFSSGTGGGEGGAADFGDRVARRRRPARGGSTSSSSKVNTPAGDGTLGVGLPRYARRPLLGRLGVDETTASLLLLAPKLCDLSREAATTAACLRQVDRREGADSTFFFRGRPQHRRGHDSTVKSTPTIFPRPSCCAVTSRARVDGCSLGDRRGD